MARACVLSSVKIALSGKEGPAWFQAGDSSIYIGYNVMYDDADEVKVAATNATASIGIAGCPSWHDNTAVFAAGVRMPVWLIGCGAEVWATHDGVAGNGSLALQYGDLLCRSNSTAGLLEEDTDYDLTTLGRITRATTITDGTAKNIRIQLSF